MVQAPGIRVPFAQAEAQRRALLAAGRLRTDLQVQTVEDGIIFPVDEADRSYDFVPRPSKARAYVDLLDWDDPQEAPRAFDVLGDVVLVKVPPAVWERRDEIGAALLTFHGARAVFHDHGVKGEFRVRELERIAGAGDSETEVQEHGVRLRVDPGKAYYSPRLASERERVAALTRPGERMLDMFGGVGPQAIQCAKRGAMVTCIDLNPEAARLAARNAQLNKVTMEVLCQDASGVEGVFDRINMNLPHGALAFLPTALRVAAPGATLHVHAIINNEQVEATEARILHACNAAMRSAESTARIVRAYSAVDSHMVFDVVVS